MLIFAPPLALPPAHGIEEYVRESSKALKEIDEGEFDVLTISEDGTTDVRMLMGDKGNAFRMTVSTGKEAVRDVSYIGGKGTMVDHESRSFAEFDSAFVQRAAKEIKGKKQEPLITVEPGTLSINLDAKEGLVIKAAPALENVRRWTSGGDELITGDIGKGKERVGTFQWVRDARTKLPKSFSSTVKGHTTDVQFVVKQRLVSLKELQIPLDTYQGYTRNVLPASGTL